jgi:hypothetical protein
MKERLYEMLEKKALEQGNQVHVDPIAVLPPQANALEPRDAAHAQNDKILVWNDEMIGQTARLPCKGMLD